MPAISYCYSSSHVKVKHPPMDRWCGRRRHGSRSPTNSIGECLANDTTRQTETYRSGRDMQEQAIHNYETIQVRKGVGRTQNFAYLGVLPHASLVAVGAPHYLAINCTRIMVDERPLLICSISYLRENRRAREILDSRQQ